MLRTYSFFYFISTYCAECVPSYLSCVPTKILDLGLSGHSSTTDQHSSRSKCTPNLLKHNLYYAQSL